MPTEAEIDAAAKAIADSPKEPVPVKWTKCSDWLSSQDCQRAARAALEAAEHVREQRHKELTGAALLPLFDKARQ